MLPKINYRECPGRIDRVIVESGRKKGFATEILWLSRGNERMKRAHKAAREATNGNGQRIDIDQWMHKRKSYIVIAEKYHVVATFKAPPAGNMRSYLHRFRLRDTDGICRYAGGQ